MHRCTDRLLSVLVVFRDGSILGNILALFVHPKGTLYIHLTNGDKTRCGQWRILIREFRSSGRVYTAFHYPRARPGFRRMIRH
jgi:hypothetical protein